jgi:hypothetical protein
MAEDPIPLTGIRTLALLIEDLPQKAVECGITLRSLDNVARFMIEQSNIQLVSTDVFFDGYIYVNVDVVPNCSSRVDVRVRTPVDIRNTAVTSWASIWEKGGLRTGGDPGEDTTLVLQQITKELVRDWNSVNQ